MFLTRPALLGFVGIALTVLCGDQPAFAAIISVYGNPADARVEDDSGDDSTRDGLGSFIDSATTANTRIGSYNADRNIAVVVPFLIPAIPMGETISAASISLYFEGIVGTPTYDVELTLLNRVSASPTLLISDFEGAGTLLNSAFVTPSSLIAQYHTFSSAALASEISSRTPGEYVFFRFKPTNNAGNYLADAGWTVTMSEGTGVAQDPLLSITTIPEPSTLVLSALGLLGFIGYRRRGMVERR